MCVKEVLDQSYHQKFVAGMQEFELTVTPGDRESLSQASPAASDTRPLLPHVYFDTDEFKPPTSWLSSCDKKGGEKAAKKRRHVLDMTELRQRAIGGNCMTDRAIGRPQYQRHMPT